jgi:putative hydrolase of the HAD superfamily
MAARAVLFDLGNTLVDYYRGAEFHPILRDCLRQVEAVVGAGGDDVFARALALNKEAADFAVRPLADRLAALFPACAGRDRDEVCRAFMGPIFACARRKGDALAVLDELRGRGIRIAIVSNTPWGSPAALWREELGRHGLLERVDAAVFCVDVGWRKPHPAPFRAALERLGTPAEDAIFVGDDPRWDVEGAQGVGVRTLLLAPGAGARSDATVIAGLREVILHAVSGG